MMAFFPSSWYTGGCGGYVWGQLQTEFTSFPPFEGFHLGETVPSWFIFKIFSQRFWNRWFLFRVFCFNHVKTKHFHILAPAHYPQAGVNRPGARFLRYWLCTKLNNKHRKRHSVTSQSSCSPPSYKAGCWRRLGVISGVRWASTGSWSGSAAHHGKLVRLPLLDARVYRWTPPQPRSCPGGRIQIQTLALFHDSRRWRWKAAGERRDSFVS